MTKEGLREALMNTLNECLAFGQRPDEYQQRHNLLVRQLAAFVLRDDIERLDSLDE